MRLVPQIWKRQREGVCVFGVCESNKKLKKEESQHIRLNKNKIKRAMMKHKEGDIETERAKHRKNDGEINKET